MRGEEVGKMVDWKDYYQTNKGRLLGIGGMLVVVGLILYFARGVEATLALVAVGIILLIAGILYKPRKKTDDTPKEHTEVSTAHSSLTYLTTSLRNVLYHTNPETTAQATESR